MSEPKTPEQWAEWGKSITTCECCGQRVRIEGSTTKCYVGMEREHASLEQQAKIDHLRSILQEVIKAYTCNNQGDCHCVTCVARHALSATSTNKKTQGT